MRSTSLAMTALSPVHTVGNQIIEAIHLKPGTSIADVGTGTGLFSRLFAAEVGPEGKVYAVDIAKNFVDHVETTARQAGLKNVVGGELVGYTELLSEARGEAIRRMSYQAEAAGANAIVNVRFATSSVAQGAAELFAYGTAVVVE